MTESEQLKEKISASMAPPTSGTRISNDDLDQLIDAFREICDANIELIAETRSQRRRLDGAQKAIRRMMIEVGVIAILGLVVVLIGYRKIEQTEQTVKANSDAAITQLKLTDRNIGKTLEVVRAAAEALSSKVSADVEALGAGVTDEELEAKASAEEAKRKALETEVQVQRDPVKRGKATKKLEQLDRDEDKRAEQSLKDEWLDEKK